MKTLREQNFDTLESLLNDFDIDPLVLLNEIVHNYMPSDEAYDALSAIIRDADLEDEFENYLN